MKTHTAAIWPTPTTPEDRFLPEGPRLIEWQGRQAVLWVNIQTSSKAITGALLLKFLDNGQFMRFPMPGRPGFVVPTEQPGQVLVGLTKTIGLFDLDSQTWSPLATIPDDHPRTIINDGEPLPNAAGVIFGTKDTRFSEPLAGLYLFTRWPQPQVTRLRDRQICSNGKVIQQSDQDLIVYDIDTPSKLVTRNRLNLSTRSLHDDGIALDLRQEPDFPDGMIEGGSGTVIIAFYNPDPAATLGRAVQYSLTTGEALQTWLTPKSPRVTCPLLIPRSLGIQLLLTTCDEGMSAEQRQHCPEAGSLFLADFA